jgi:hypothetical protein
MILKLILEKWVEKKRIEFSCLMIGFRENDYVFYNNREFRVACVNKLYQGFTVFTILEGGKLIIGYI